MDRAQFRSRGFTLVELVMVLILGGILSAVAYSRLSTDPVVLPTQAQRLAAVIRYAQNQAMTQGVRYQVRFTATTYDVYSTAGGVATQVREPGTGQFGPYALASGVTITIPPALSNSALTFDGRGIPYTNLAAPDSLLSPNAATLTLSKGAATGAIVISPDTGRVVVQ